MKIRMFSTKNLSQWTVTFASTVALSLILPVTALAQVSGDQPSVESSPTPKTELAVQTSQFDDDWHFLISVPLWMPSISGHLQTINFGSIPVNASFSDVLSHFTFGAMAHAEARKSRFGLGLDVMYVNLSDTLDRNAIIPALRTFQLGLKQVFAEGFGFYRVIQEGNPVNPFFLDLIAGARYYWTESQINNFYASLYWVDLMLGLRGQIAVGDHLSLRGRSDYAFLGSVFTWNLIGEAAWTFNGNWTVTAGYRAMDIDYENPNTSRVWNLNYHGPVLGAVFNW